MSGIFDMDCSVCRNVEWKREEWGCDAEKRSQVAYVTCWSCIGRGCKECVAGKRSLHRCPNAVLTQECAEVCALFPLWEAGAMPVSGGVLDQGHAFYRAMLLLRGEIGKHRGGEE